MKTDVIFLGAGASASAGFPVGCGLAEYIKLQFTNRTQSDCNKWPCQTFQDVARLLIENNRDSVDDFAQWAKKWRPDLTHTIKTMIRCALFDHSSKWRGQTNEYDRLVQRLLRKNDYEPDERVTVVNFNYDGLFGKLLADTVYARKERSAHLEDLAAYAGGYYSRPEDGPVSKAIIGFPSRTEDSFEHCMPHGTAVTVWREQTALSLLNLVFPEDDTLSPEEREAEFSKTHGAENFIRFPWDEAHADVGYWHNRQPITTI